MEKPFLKCLIGTLIASAVSVIFHCLFNVEGDVKSYIISATIFFVLIFVAELFREMLTKLHSHRP